MGLHTTTEKAFASGAIGRNAGHWLFSFLDSAMDWLVRYPWPGEIRELGNVVERAVIVSRASASEVSLRDWNSRIPTVNDEDQGRAEDNCLGPFRPSRCRNAFGMNRSTFDFRRRELGIYRSRNAKFDSSTEGHGTSLVRREVGRVTP